MTLREKQSRFVNMIADLIFCADYFGYELTLPDSRTKHMKNSLHHIGLAIDFNLFKDGVYLKETSDHAFLGQFWESIGGTWGGRFGDGNHYSLEHGGRK